MKQQEKHSNFERPVFKRPVLTKDKAFTLVELIVVITILAILGIIVFISLQGYSKDARDSTRISDLSAIKTSLELFYLDAGKYPDPTDGFDIQYSGSTVWTQGTFGETTFSSVSKLDKIPTDPLTDKEYTYSVTNKKQEYQLAGIMEGDGISLNNSPYPTPLTRGEGVATLIAKTNAGELITTALVTGTYNGQMLKTESGTNCNILSVPSIISSEPNIITDLITILTNTGLVYNGYKNLPTNYITSKYKTDGGFGFKSNKLIVYDDSESCTPLYNPEDNTARLELLTNLQEAYSGTLIKNEDGIDGIVNIDLTDTDTLDIISTTIINNNLGGSIVVNSGGGSGTPSECKVGMTELTLANGQTWSCMNLGATTVRDGTTQPTNCNGSITNCNSGLTWLGNYYQRGKNDTSWTNGQAASPYNFGWEPQNDTRWGGSTGDTITADGIGTTAIGRQGPCPIGRHVPSAKDWQNACNTILGTTCADGMPYNTGVSTKLKLPFSGKIDNGLYGGQSITVSYWASSPYSTTLYAHIFEFFKIDDWSEMLPCNGTFREYGLNIRCLKN